MAPKKRKLPSCRARTQRVIERDVLTLEAPSCARLTGNQVCGACLLPLESDAKVGALDNCSHVFHFECVEKWSQTENTCPQCKHRFFWLASYKAGKRASLRQVQSKDQEEQEEPEFEEVTVCEKCKEVGDEGQLLLCDGMHGTCNAPFHFTCVGLTSVPRGSWFCPDCVERGFDEDAQGNRRATSSRPPATPVAEASAARSSSTSAGPEVPVASPQTRAAQGPDTASYRRAPGRSAGRGRGLPSQMRLSALACVTPAVEVPTFQPSTTGSAEQPAGLFASFAARRRARQGGSAAQPCSSFISLNPTYEDDCFMSGKADAKGDG